MGNNYTFEYKPMKFNVAELMLQSAIYNPVDIENDHTAMETVIPNRNKGDLDDLLHPHRDSVK